MILLTNETTKDASLTVDSAIINYPPTNILDSRLSRIYRTNATTTAEIVYSMTSAITVNAIAIANHNITSSATAIKIQGNASDVWTSPSFSQDITWDSDIMTATFTDQSYQYWRLQIIDATNPDSYLEMGRVWIGESFQSPGISPTLTHDKVSASIKSKSTGGQTYQDGRYFYHVVNTTYPAVTHAEKAEIFQQFEYTDVGIPYFTIFDEDCIDLDVLYCTQVEDTIRATLLNNKDYYTIGYTIEEEV
jgi:hypothetical protein